ncbi:MAG: (2Fe-2S)-binding protein, partial [Actinomycetota bacterium]|nr:(2Fe-2S)-binding protein [Actinomycetota bacterium]
MEVTLNINGVEQSHDVEPRTLLVQFIRESAGLTGTNIGCDTSSCGACTVHLNGESIKSCTVLAAQVDGMEVTTIEGLAQSDGTLHPMQQAFHECHALQCGYCTPGMIMACVSLVEENETLTEGEVREGLEG